LIVEPSRARADIGATRAPFFCPSLVTVTSKARLPLDFETLLKMQLVRLKLRQRDLADRLGIPASTLSTYLHGRLPTGFRERCESALGLHAGALRAAKAAPAAKGVG
jgi:hypothetical protein